MNEAMARANPLFKVTEVARRLSVSRAFVYQLMDRGLLPYVKLGTARRIRAEDVEQLLARNTIGNAA
jgi:excisionase family DNA binding protein